MSHPPAVPAGPLDLEAWLAGRRPPALPCPALPLPRPGTGAGVRIALLDGQVDLDHPDLRGARVRAWAPHGLSLPDPTGHATACASLLVGQGVAQVRGLVPDAELLVAAVLPENPLEPGADERVAQGIGWATYRGAEVIVLPFGRRRLGRRVTTALRSAVASGVAVYAAAGNIGADVLAFPAAVAGVRAVTAYDDAGLVAGCSAVADLAGPGRVPAAGPDRRVTLHGSSPAAVLAAGVHARARSAAQVREAGQGHRIRVV